MCPVSAIDFYLSETREHKLDQVKIARTHGTLGTPSVRFNTAARRIPASPIWSSIMNIAKSREGTGFLGPLRG
jgi:hypothetical protein